MNGQMHFNDKMIRFGKTKKQFIIYQFIGYSVLISYICNFLLVAQTKYFFTEKSLEEKIKPIKAIKSYQIKLRRIKTFIVSTILNCIYNFYCCAYFLIICFIYV